MANYKLKVTEDCIGCGACINVADELFEMDNKTNKSKPKKKTITDKELGKAKEAKEICPVDAIKVEKA